MTLQQYSIKQEHDRIKQECKTVKKIIDKIWEAPGNSLREDVVQQLCIDNDIDFERFTEIWELADRFEREKARTGRRANWV